MLLKCKNCGFELTEGTKFCPECGSKVEVDPMNLEERTDVQKEKMGGGKVKGCFFVLLTIAFISTLIGFTIMGVKSCSKPSKTEIQSDVSTAVSLPEYTILDDRVYDAPVKTEVSLDVLVSGDINEQNLRNLFNKLYPSIKSRTGFKYHDSPTNIYIYLFTSKEKAKAGAGFHIAMLDKSYDDKEPRINIHSELISQIDEKPEEKFGLTEDERKSIYKQISRNEEIASDKAFEKFPNDALKQADLMDELTKKYQNELCKKYGLTEEQYLDIIVEGVTKKWLY